MTWEADVCRIEEASARTSQGGIGLGSWVRARNGGGASLMLPCNAMFLNRIQAVIGCLKRMLLNVRFVVCVSVCVFIRCISNLPYHACCCSTVTFAHANFSAASALLHLVRSNQKKTMFSSNESKEAGLACVFPRDYYFSGIILIV